MGFTALHILLWLLTAFALTTQELAKLIVSPQIAAECGKQVTLDCAVSSSRKGLVVRHMEWSRNKTTLCSVNREGNITTHHRHTLRDFHCEYKHGQLSLVLQKAKPLDSGDYMCKLQCNQGAPHEHTRVELQECCGSIKGEVTPKGPTCTFQRVHPDGDVHWSHASHNLSDEPLRHHTTKSVDEEGWLTIHSYLKQKSSDVRYSCSLKSTRSGRYIASTCVQNPVSQVRDGVGSRTPLRTSLCISVLLAFTMR